MRQEDGEESVAKVFGQAVHAGLDTHYKGGSFKEVIYAFDRQMNGLTSEKKEYSLESGHVLLENYLKHYETMDKDLRVIASELEGEVETLTGSHELHIDLVVEHLPSSSIYFVDHKTSTKALSPVFWRRFEVDAQMSRYTKFTADRFGGCAGCIINGISFGYRSRKYKEEPAGFHQTFTRQIFNRTQAQLDYWMASDKKWERLIEMAKKEDCFPSSLNGLCSYCEFYAYCMSGCEEGLLETLYQQQSK